MTPPDHHARSNSAHTATMATPTSAIRLELESEAREEEWNGHGDSEVQHME